MRQRSGFLKSLGLAAALGAVDALKVQQDNTTTDISTLFSSIDDQLAQKDAQIKAVKAENEQLIDEIGAERLASEEAAAMIAEEMADTKEDVDQARIDIAAAQAAVDKASARIDGANGDGTQATTSDGSKPEEDIISTALFDLNAEELAALYAMEEEIYEDSTGTTSPDNDQIQQNLSEIAAIEKAEAALDNMQSGDIGDMDMKAWEAEMAAIEAALMQSNGMGGAGDDDLGFGGSLEDYMADEMDDDMMYSNDPLDKLDDLDAEFAAEEALANQKIPESLDLTGMKILCKDTTDAYVAQISSLQTELQQAKSLSDNMATALSEIDPNMDNGAEGKAFIRKMYKLKNANKQPTSVIPTFPKTPEPCVEMVAGKVIQIEDLEEQVSEAESFRNFFAEVYCAAYVNALVTMKDGLYQIFPGGLDQSIAKELQRLYGPLDEGSAELDAIEIASVEAYFDALTNGLWQADSSSLIQVGEPLNDALNLCAANVNEDVALAQQDREDYLNDLNFLNYLKSL